MGVVIGEEQRSHELTTTAGTSTVGRQRAVLLSRLLLLLLEVVEVVP